MTAYVFTPLCPVPAPVSTGGSGYVQATVWGAGLRAGSLPIRIGKIENFTPVNAIAGGGGVNMYRSDSATFNSSTVIPAIVPPPLRQGAYPCSTTTGISTVTRFYNSGSGTYSYSISGAVPTGTLQFIGSCPPSSGAGSPGAYQFSPGVIVQPGGMFWIGSNVTATATTIPIYRSGPVADDQVSGISLNIRTAANIFFEEIRLQPGN